MWLEEKQLKKNKLKAAENIKIWYLYCSQNVWREIYSLGVKNC